MDYILNNKKNKPRGNSPGLFSGRRFSVVVFLVIVLPVEILDLVEDPGELVQVLGRHPRKLLLGLLALQALELLFSGVGDCVADELRRGAPRLTREGINLAAVISGSKLCHINFLSAQLGL